MYEIIVVDNGSDPSEYGLVSQACETFDARLISLNQNLYFGEANNIAAEAACGKMLLFLNNDVILTPQYIEPLISTLDHAFCAGAVGPRFIYPDGRLQEVGAYIRADGWTIRHGNSDAPSDIITAPGHHIVDYCSAACLLMRRDVFLSVGGFDPLFDPAYFEDVDLMLRLRSMGLYTYLCPNVTVIHDENTTSKVVWDNDGHLAIVAKGHAKFVKRWGIYLKRRIFSDDHLPEMRSIAWEPEKQVPDNIQIVFFQGPGLICQSLLWAEIIALAARLSDRFHIVLAADEACSRCRVLTLAKKLEVSIASFSISKASDLKISHENTLIVFSENIDGNIAISSSCGPNVDQVQAALSGKHQDVQFMLEN
jgi:GT2 family glycosyltransferase